MERTPSGCYSQTGCGRPRAACRQRLDAVGLGNAFLVLNLGLHVIMESGSTSVMVLPVRVLTKICMPPRRRSTKWSVDLLDVIVDGVRPSSSCLPAKLDAVGPENATG